MFLPHILTLLALSPSSWAGITVQKVNLTVPPEYAGNRAAAQDIFTKSYAAYKKSAFGHDELMPGTMLVMGMNDSFIDALDFIGKINFSIPPAGGTVSVFETTIRFIGGLLSAYELSGGQHSILVDKAQQVADKLAFAWVGHNDIPFGHIDFSTNTPTAAVTNIAEAGSLALEWMTLTQFTGNTAYGNLATRALAHIANLRNQDPLPGLAAQNIDPTSGGFQGSKVSWGGGSDSYFEYLLKYARLSNTNDNTFIDTWQTAVDSSIRTLLKTSPSIAGSHYYLADYEDGDTINIGSHLACFFPGNWLLGGKLLKNQTIIDLALKLNDGCWASCLTLLPNLLTTATFRIRTLVLRLTGIRPDGFAFISSDGSTSLGALGLTPHEWTFSEKHGFYITSAVYIQRPEVLESNFYAWRITGNMKYLDCAAAAIASFNKYLQTNGTFAGLNDVDNPRKGLIDTTESFWYAEVLKYLYLTFDDPAHISLDDYVFNTECHPLKAPPALDSYGSQPVTAPNETGVPLAIKPMQNRQEAADKE
ncbi:glycoside hydrolase family 47 protein [Mycena latifolia]|nr:glycoside hydrolase family 47 protein [Mycena latifolia]